MIFIFYGFAILSLVVGTAAIYMTLIQSFPVQWLYYHYFIRKPITWSILVGGGVATVLITWKTGEFPLWTLLPLMLMGLAVVLAYRMHQESAFKAVDFPVMANDPLNLPLQDDMQLGVIEYNGVTKAYPLDYVIHHHIINDRFGDRLVALTYCAMCHSIIPFDVSDIGPLFVGSFKNANMIVADRKTKTFFQQATFESIIGRLHPRTLTMIPFQILPWAEVKQLSPCPQLVKVTKQDFKEFQLPVPGVWKNILASEFTPGLSATQRDTTFPARTRVVGIIDNIAQPQVAYLKEELLTQGVITNDELDVVLVAVSNTVLGFKRSVAGAPVNITLNADNTLADISSGTVWDIRGKYMAGEVTADLMPIAISDEYWFSWKLFHSGSTLIRL
ncbi:DUF3179 domain-containing (seleno)protein [Nitrincola iocasae]|uniref:DUF3179 domain-containing protein n=1 Tax=Nitrincola iocasae TaxID=2614693 RepID=A0A5J6LE49_9GAMM|nr:DUF3179 domain-containing (seleno)protein [Nitrincola iocasae]QEW06658.1 DUF3179 domain-containing protein [Nitrincola iocasae]